MAPSSKRAARLARSKRRGRCSRSRWTMPSITFPGRGAAGEHARSGGTIIHETSTGRQTSVNTSLQTFRRQTRLNREAKPTIRPDRNTSNRHRVSSRASLSRGTRNPGKTRTMSLESEGVSSSIPGSTKGRESHLTQNSLHELLDTEQARVLLEVGEERGYVEPSELEAFALENDLGDEEVEALSRELETIGLEVRQMQVVEEATRPANLNLDPEELVGSADSLQLFLADVGKHKLLTAAEEVTLAKRIERGDPIAKRRMIESNLRLVVSIAKGYRGLGAAQASVSLNQTVGADDEGELGDLFADREAADPFDEAEESLRRQGVRRALDALPERERRILELRFGFEGEPWTLEAIGHELDLTRERVRQLEAQALARLSALRELSSLAA